LGSFCPEQRCRSRYFLLFCLARQLLFGGAIQMKVGSSMNVPRSLLLVAGLTTAAITAWVILGSDVSGPWLAKLTAADSSSAAALRPIGPTIQLGRAAPHAEFGPCTLCHRILARGNRPIPAIGPSARLAHQYQGGVCVNCHRIGAGLTNSVERSATNPVERRAAQQEAAALRQDNATPPARWAGRGAPQDRGAASTAPQLPSLSMTRSAPSSAEWLGMQLIPLDPELAERQGLSRELNGLLITRAREEASAAGLRPGDILIAINRLMVGDLSRLQELTEDGTLSRGVLQILRHGNLFRVVLSSATRPPQASPPRAAHPQSPSGGGAIQAPPTIMNQAYASSPPADEQPARAAGSPPRSSAPEAAAHDHDVDPER
jgi:hypothetical protein